MGAFTVLLYHGEGNGDDNEDEYQLDPRAVAAAVGQCTKNFSERAVSVCLTTLLSMMGWESHLLVTRGALASLTLFVYALLSVYEFLARGQADWRGTPGA